VSCSVQPSLLVTNRYYIRNISTDGLRIDNLATNLSNAVALDYDWFEQKIYWTDVTSMGSVIGRMDFSGSNREVRVRT
jgi:low-density lipoprotein receptor-related protein 1 (alpha-2-macroglobulin receptor)